MVFVANILLQNYIKPELFTDVGRLEGLACLFGLDQLTKILTDLKNFTSLTVFVVFVALTVF